MAIQPKKYVRKQFAVEAVEVTPANIQEVADWCGGEVQKDKKKYGPGTTKFVHVDVKNAINERQTRAYFGDWVLSSESGFKIYTKKAFVASFEEQVDNMFKVVERMEKRAEQEERLFEDGDLREPTAVDDPAV